jgi:putative endonuclease
MTDLRRIQLGVIGEAAALSWYERAGFSLVARNWRCKSGEIDLVVSRADVLVFCEVKTRSGAAFGGGFESVTSVKRARLRRLAELFLLSEVRGREYRVRFDVASVSIDARERTDVQIFDDAF